MVHKSVAAAVAALNVLYGYPADGKRRPLLATHWKAYAMMADKYMRHVVRLASGDDPGTAPQCLDRVLSRGSENAQVVPTQAKLCDVFPSCGHIDPLQALTPEQRAIVNIQAESEEYQERAYSWQVKIISSRTYRWL